MSGQPYAAGGIATTVAATRAADDAALAAGVERLSDELLLAGVTTFETKSGWVPLVHFFYDAERPEAFIVFETVNLMVDSGDPTVMRGRFKIAKWFAPAGQK